MEAYIIPITKSIDIFPLLVVLLLVPVSIVQFWLYDRLEKRRQLIFFSFIFFILTALFLVVLPLPEITENFCDIYEITKAPQLHLFNFLKDIASEFQVEHIINIRTFLTNSAVLQVVFNFLLLMPLGIYAKFYFKLNWIKTALLAFLISLSFELIQLSGTFGLYPCSYRLFDVDDLFLNFTGAMFGFLISPSWLDIKNIETKKIILNPSIYRRGIAFFIDIAFVIPLIQLLINKIVNIPEIIIVLTYFIGLNFITKGSTIGKFIVRIKLKINEEPVVRTKQLLIRYGVLFGPYTFVILLVELLSIQLIDNPIILVILLLLYMIFIIVSYPVIMLYRKDDKGLHEIISKVSNKVVLRKEPDHQD